MFAFANAGRSAGAETLVVTTGDNEPGTKETAVRCFRRNFQPYKISFSLRRWLNRHVREFDLVHIHALFSFSSWAAAHAAQKQNVPYVIRPLGVLNRWGLTNRRRFLKQFWLRFIEAPALERAAAIHYTSQAERDQAAMISEQIARLPWFMIPIPVDGSQGANFTAGGREPSANRPREAGDSALVKTEGTKTAFLQHYPKLLLT